MIDKPLLVDSITEAVGHGAGRVVVSGSHGGLSSARFAIETAPRLEVFNDAGMGKDAAGIAGLALLQTHGIAACTVAHTSARIGQARSTLEDGVVSHANGAAAALGVAPGRPLRQALSYHVAFNNLDIMSFHGLPGAVDEDTDRG